MTAYQLSLFPNAEYISSKSNNLDDLSSAYRNFKSGEIINELEMNVMDILEIVLGNNFHYCPQVTLNSICCQTGWIPKNIWEIWINSKVDIAVIERGLKTNRQAKLVIECQSIWHKSPELKESQRLKSQILSAVNIPLIYVEQVREDERFYRFYIPNQTAEIFYNLITQDDRQKLKAFLEQYIV
ncbi:hypothetical protein [Dapis sp. BLCC M229]|uniref:hypothetical protein n=1 Tax=Dapis sp. BLCC M229 TaxID=3400188 RepID=UPI003CF8B97F